MQESALKNQKDSDRDDEQENSVTFYAQGIPFGTAYYYCYHGKYYIAGEYMTLPYEVDDIPKDSCNKYVFQWGKTYKSRRFETYYEFISENNIIITHGGRQYKYDSLNKFADNQPMLDDIELHE